MKGATSPFFGILQMDFQRIMNEQKRAIVRRSVQPNSGDPYWLVKTDDPTDHNCVTKRTILPIVYVHCKLKCGEDLNSIILIAYRIFRYHKNGNNY